MDIISVIQSFSHLSPDNKLVITIGKSISRQCFSINNKIFFDILKTYLQKNGWFVGVQYLSKRYYFEDKYLESITENKKCNVLNLEVPITQNASLYGVEYETVVKYKGTYFDIFCQQSKTSLIENTDEFSENITKIYSEVQEEISVFKKGNSGLEIIFSVNKEKEPTIFSIRMNVSSMNELEQEEFLEVFELIELAMCKYKKTDKGISSVFQNI